jgi:hypothetical protein
LRREVERYKERCKGGLNLSSEYDHSLLYMSYEILDTRSNLDSCVNIFLKMYKICRRKEGERARKEEIRKHMSHQWRMEGESRRGQKTFDNILE